MELQRSLDWHRKRLGMFTGSNIGLLFKKGKAKDAMFGETALSYIHKVAAERLMNKQIVEDDDWFSAYIEQTQISSKAIKWGIENEEYARAKFEKATGLHVEEVGSIIHKTYKTLAASPDGLTSDEGIIEIKCPNMDTYVKYRTRIFDANSLLSIMPEYYYQMQAEMAVSERKHGYFVAYCPFIKKPLHIVKVARNNNIINEMYSRIENAEIIAKSVIERYNINSNVYNK